MKTIKKKPEPSGSKLPALQPDESCNKRIISWGDKEQTYTMWDYCRTPAGWSTEHIGVGRCKRHEKIRKNAASRALVKVEDQIKLINNYDEVFLCKEEIEIATTIMRRFKKEDDRYGALKAADVLQRVKKTSFGISKELNGLIPEEKVQVIVMRLFDAAKKYMSSRDELRFGNDLMMVLNSELGNIISTARKADAIEGEFRERKAS